MRMAFFITVVAALFLPNLINKDINPRPPLNHLEDFDESLSSITTIEKLENYIDSIALAQNLTTGSFEYVLLAESITRKRFYHGFSHFTLQENWIAAISGRLLEEGLACKVKPDDILQHSNAACSQQSIVLMALLRNKSIPYHKIGFPHHFAMEAMIDNKWYFLDPDMEPHITKEQRMESNWKLKPDVLKPYYDSRRYSDLDYVLGVGLTATTGAINEIPATRVMIFHAVTGVLSKILWCLPLLFVLLSPYCSFRPLPRLYFLRKKNIPSLAGV